MLLARNGRLKPGRAWQVQTIWLLVPRRASGSRLDQKSFHPSGRAHRKESEQRGSRGGLPWPRDLLCDMRGHGRRFCGGISRDGRRSACLESLRSDRLGFALGDRPSVYEIRDCCGRRDQDKSEG